MKIDDICEDEDRNPRLEADADAGRREFLRLFALAVIAPFANRLAVAESQAASQPAKYYGAFAELPVGAVKPLGWTKLWLERQAKGLSGHPENMAYPYDTCMLAGVIPPPPNKHGDVWWPYEQSGYFFDAATRLNQLIDDPRVKQLHQAALDYILANSTERGYGASVWNWPNAVIGRGLLADDSATDDPARKRAIADLITRYIDSHGKARDRDGVNAEEALYLYGVTGEAQLLDYAEKVYKVYIAEDSWCSTAKIEGPDPLRQHGVTAAEMLKILALNYLYTGDADALKLAVTAYDKVVSDSLMPDGGIVSQEFMGTSKFGSLHESCDITDWSWSMGYCLMATGDARWADLIERAIFNALPGAVTKDFKQAQYYSGANQVLITSLSNRGDSASTRMSYRAAHDTQCCVGNINRAMPNYVVRQWMKTPEGGLAAVLYGPSELTTTVNGERITIVQETEYPFRETIVFKVRAAQPVRFLLRLRIPGWCESAHIEINGRAYAGKKEAGTFAEISRRFRDGDVIRLRLPMTVRMEEWYQGQCVALMRGPLLYSIEIEEKRVEITKDTPQVEKVLHGNLIGGFPAVEFYPKSEWRYGIDAALKTSVHPVRVVERPMTDNPFLPGHAPVSLEVPLRPLPNWEASFVAEPAPQPNGDIVAVKTPGELPSTEELKNPGTAKRIKMVPSGGTHLRLTTIPVLQD
jgi:hypothetical protein